MGLHPDDPDAREFELLGKRALIVCTNHGVLDIGKATGVFASEMTVPYYAFLDAGMFVDLASPDGGVIPVDPQSVKPVIRSAEDDRFLADDDLREKVGNSLAIADVDVASYDIVFLAGGWGAAFDLGTSDALGEKITEANALGKVIGGVCHGPLGLLKATAADGTPLVEGRRISAVTDKQVRELGIESTPQHPETRTPGGRGAVRERIGATRSARQPLGGRRQPRHRPEPERRADGGPRDDADPREGCDVMSDTGTPALRRRRPQLRHAAGHHARRKTTARCGWST